MKTLNAVILASTLVLPAALSAQSPEGRGEANAKANPTVVPRGDVWVRTLKDRAGRGTLHDAFRYVRGDSGKWNDEPILQHAPSIRQKPMKINLDDWADDLMDQDIQLTAGDESWLLMRTRQLDDNDRVWIERIERRGRQFTIVAHQAIWQGRYMKTFTYHSAFGVNLGKLAPGEYQVKWIVKPLVFKQFDGEGRPIDLWPKDEQPATQKPTEIQATFRVADVPRPADE